MRINKRVLYCIVLLYFSVNIFIGCNKGDANKEFVQIDTLLCQKQYESALKKIRTIDASNLSDQDKAYYSLLKTQADYKNYIVATTDSAINFAVDYYSQ